MRYWRNKLQCAEGAIGGRGKVRGIISHEITKVSIPKTLTVGTSEVGRLSLRMPLYIKVLYAKHHSSPKNDCDFST